MTTTTNPTAPATMTTKPVKIYDYRGEKTYKFMGRTIHTKAHREGCYPRKVIHWTSAYVDGKHVSGGIKEAVKLIESGKI